jgi:hypothetical protein
MRSQVVQYIPEYKQLSKKTAAVMFTNFNDLNTINKTTGKLFYDNYESFLQTAIRGDPKSHYYEKSVRDVYEALEKDFDPLEDELVAGTQI